ncbi:hypothetical protein MTsPCn5_30130 [Croceitalea sp. MTPC5]|uniref:toxin-antitoxin system YwqK family antitoxin n=1 Tax=Croceitalea sp. MTPC5 TaxID=3056565 RepID=UPI002B3D3748|nr:hypothetical protein MTsPCn5_30130 [Croceitalea sp. MTPC5]
MKIKRNTLQIGVRMAMFFIVTITWAQNDTLYYDSKWIPTVKDSAAFYRPPVKERGGVYLVKDYYVSGQLQMTATSTSREKDIWQGVVTWYNEDGSIFQQGNYKDNRLEGEFVTYLNGQKLISKYANGYFVSGKRNSPMGTLQMYTERVEDSLVEISYEKDINGIRYEYYGTKERPRGLSKYYDKGGKLIGERVLLPNGYYKGVEVFYYYNPMRIREINYYPSGQLLISSSFYPNGQVREKVEKTPLWSKTYFTKAGKQLGKITYELEGDRLKQKDGTEFFFSYGKGGEKTGVTQSARSYVDGIISEDRFYHENGQLKSMTTYDKGTRQLQVSYDESGEEMARMVYKDYRPYDGTEILYDRKATYEGGELIEEVTFYPKSEKPRSKKTKEREVFYDMQGKVLGELKLEYGNGYAKPVSGQRYTTSSTDGDISSIEIFKDGVVVNRMSFRKRLVGKDLYRTFKRIEEYGTDGYKKTREIKFYSNNKKQSDIYFKDYKETEGTFYNDQGEQIGTYDFEKKEGKYFEFFGDSDHLRLMEERKNGKIVALKRYDYGKSNGYGNINPILVEEIDVDCCGTFYDANGAVLGKVTYKDSSPWEGTWYDKDKRKRYTLKGGKRNGRYQKLDYDQRILEEGQFVADKETGTFNYYDYMGNLKKAENYSDGKLNGKTLYYNELGKVFAEITYREGLPVDGTRILDSYYGKNPNMETYKNGQLIKQVKYDGQGKTITLYSGNGEVRSTAYYKDSDKKRLGYTLSNASLDGKVIRYDKTGKQQYEAIFEKGKLISGSVLLMPRYQDNRVKNVLVNKKDSTLAIKLFDFDDNVILSAEEHLLEGASIRYLNKFDVDLNYVTDTNLY